MAVTYAPLPSEGDAMDRIEGICSYLPQVQIVVPNVYSISGRSSGTRKDSRDVGHHDYS